MTEPTGNEIAVVGMAGRFPGARDVAEFWRNLEAGVESIVELDDRELLAHGVAPEAVRDPRYVKAAAVADGIELFDAEFFGMTAREAALVDPQHRLLLETAWEALEDAGYDADSYRGSIGVYAGATINTYLLFHLQGNPEVAESLDLAQLNIANGRDFLTTRVSYKLNLRGPSHVVQSACSTSLVAVHQGAQSLLDHECDLVLAGGVSVNVRLRWGYRHLEGGMASPDGRCRPFDARAAGTIFGSGVGLVVLKRLDDALAEGDTIRAVIRGSAINNDGDAKVGYTAPSVEGQARAITEALANAGVEPASVGYVECHGTATPLGDPIEIQALHRAFGAAGSAPERCPIGSVKSNIGHLDAAAGAASLIKTVLALEHRTIPPSLHFERPNPEIDFAAGPFYVNARPAEWRRRGDTPRRAGVSSFGVGGTNAHLIVEEAPAVEASGPSRPWQLLPLSARTPEALAARATAIAGALSERPELELADVAFTLGVGRRRFAHRRALVCRHREEAIAQLLGGPAAGVGEMHGERVDLPVVFLFPDAADHPPGAGVELYRQEPELRRHLDACAAALPGGGESSADALLRAGDAGGGGRGTPRVAAFALQYALGRLWTSWGLRPQGLFGQGSGEYVAACLAGVMSLEDALALAAARGAAAALAPEAGRAAFADELRRIDLGAPRIPFVSGVTGDWIGERTAADADYWKRQRERSCEASAGLATLLDEPGRALLEIGGGAVLGPAAAAHPARRPEQLVVSSLAPRSGPAPEVAGLLTALARLWLAGAAVDWSALHAGERRRRVPLPTYPFERRRYWIEPRPGSGGARRAAAAEGETVPSAAAATVHPRPDLETPYVAPTSELGRRVARIWAGALGLERVGLDDSFFDLGGDSLVAVQVMDELTLELGREVPAVALYEELTIRALLELLEAGGEETATPAVAAPARQAERVQRRKSFQQRRRARRRSADSVEA